MPEGISVARPTMSVQPAESHIQAQSLVSSNAIVPEELWGMFDINDARITENGREQSKINNILSYFMEGSEGKYSKALLDMRRAMNNFGTPSIGSNRLDQMMQYVTIQRQIGALENRKSALTNNLKKSKK